MTKINRGLNTMLLVSEGVGGEKESKHILILLLQENMAHLLIFIKILSKILCYFNVSWVKRNIYI